MSSTTDVRRAPVKTAETFRAATFRRLVPAPGVAMPPPGTRIVAGTLVEEDDSSAVQPTGSIR